VEALGQMVVFSRVVEAGSFSEAARRLGSSKSAVSRCVARLEQRLDAQLLQRTTRRLALTEAGRLFHARCSSILREIEDAERAVSGAQGAPRGVLRVNAPVSFGQRELAPIVPAFMSRHPELSLDLVLDDRRVDALEGAFDVSVRLAPRLPDSSAIARRIASLRLVVCAAPSYLERRGAPRSPTELASHECLIYSNHERWLFGGRSRAEESMRVSGRLRANNGEALRGALLAGLGLAQIPSFIVAADVQCGALTVVLERFEPRSPAIWALYSQTRHVSTKVRAFIDFLSERFGTALESVPPAAAIMEPRSARRAAR